ncbi:Aste57867_8336 [Aphanomyces stellatus]|uniref:Aste57867_8336 protein n=1 Tax=Aphanomyces stellatus TaxID=120398 RepID=A0A485KJZ5_9STRA|nr:hypothetical protein As57867_008304 [Aphanomyces stellatus]VFT85223.1 Aste57867_8336 [Aphanomyces stellatus]
MTTAWTYATLVTSDEFVIGVEVLAYSLRKYGAKFPLLVLYTDQLSAHGVQKLQRIDPATTTPRRVDALPNPNVEVHVPGWVNSGYTKLHVFNLVEFAKVFYIDSDAFVLANVDDMFERDIAPYPFAAAPDIFPPDRFNAGVLLVQPSAALFRDLMDQIALLPSYDGGDTGYLNAFFPDWFTSDSRARLPFAYNAQRTMHWLTHDTKPGYWDAVGRVKILHCSSSPKPWENPAKKGELEMLWWHYYTEMHCV